MTSSYTPPVRIGRQGLVHPIFSDEARRMVLHLLKAARADRERRDNTPQR